MTKRPEMGGDVAPHLSSEPEADSDSSEKDTLRIQFHGRKSSTSMVGKSDVWSLPRLVALSANKARPGYNTFAANEYLDSPRTLKSKLAVLADMMKASKATVVYTGAGISTAAGIGDYATNANSSVAPHKAAPRETGSRLGLQPTKSHRCIVAMRKYIHHWLQQNHDRLAQKAGWPQEKINEIHGAWGDMKNSVVQMNESLRSDLYEWLVFWENNAELCIALGTSMCGMRADGIARHAAQKGGLVIVGLQRTPFDEHAALRIWGCLDDVMSELAKQLKVKVPVKIDPRGVEWQNTHPNCRYDTTKRSKDAPN